MLALPPGSARRPRRSSSRCRVTLDLDIDPRAQPIYMLELFGNFQDQLFSFHLTPFEHTRAYPARQLSLSCFLSHASGQAIHLSAAGLRFLPRRLLRANPQALGHQVSGGQACFTGRLRIGRYIVLLLLLQCTVPAPGFFCMPACIPRLRSLTRPVFCSWCGGSRAGSWGLGCRVRSASSRGHPERSSGHPPRACFALYTFSPTDSRARSAPYSRGELSALPRCFRSCSCYACYSLLPAAIHPVPSCHSRYLPKPDSIILAMQGTPPASPSPASPAAAAVPTPGLPPTPEVSSWPA